MEEGQTAGAGTRAQSIAEHAFTKGLERFARATTTVTAAARPQSMIVGSPQRSSGEFKRGRTGSHASEDFKDLDTGATTAPVPTETIVVKDDVGGPLLVFKYANVRRPMRTDGFMEIISGRTWVLEAV